MPAEGTTAQINKNLRFLMDLLGQERIIGKRQKGYERLETQQHENMLERAKKDWLYQISQDPSINRIVSQRFINAQEGTSNVELDKQLKQAIDDTVGLVYSTSTGQTPTKGMWEKGLSNISDMTLREILAQTATAARQKEALPYEAAGLGLRAEESRTAQRKLQFEIDKLGQKSHEDQLGAWTDIVTDAINFLEAEGVKKEAGGAAIRALFSSGKVLDPLTKEDRGQAFGWLTFIQSKLAKGQLPSPGEEWFLINVRNSPAITRTGLINPAELDTYANYYMREHGLSREEAYNAARDYVLTKRGKTQRK